MNFQLGDIIDVRDDKMGAWFESKIVKITRNKEKEPDAEKKDKNKENGDVVMVDDDDDEAVLNDGEMPDDGFLYHIVFEGYAHFISHSV